MCSLGEAAGDCGLLHDQVVFVQSVLDKLIFTVFLLPLQEMKILEVVYSDKIHSWSHFSQALTIRRTGSPHSLLVSTAKQHFIVLVNVFAVAELVLSERNSGESGYQARKRLTQLMRRSWWRYTPPSTPTTPVRSSVIT